MGEATPAGDPLDIMLGHERWATRQVLETCAKLTPDQFHRRFEMGPGSLHDTTTHMLGAMRVWTDLLAGREQRPRLEGTKSTPAQLMAIHDELATNLAAVARAHRFDELVTRTRDGQSWTYPRGGVLMHVATHGVHHRAQCLNMLRQIGASPLPPVSVLEWILATGGARSR